MRDAGQNWNGELHGGEHTIGVHIAGKGELIVGGDFTIEGRFLGKLQVRGCLTVGRDAVVTGDLMVTNLELHGKINGSVRVTDKAVFHSSCSLSGSVTAGTGEIMEGSHISGEHRFERTIDADVQGLFQPAMELHPEMQMPWHQTF